MTLPRPPLVPRRCHRPPRVTPRRTAGPQHRAPFMRRGGVPGSHLASPRPPGVENGPLSGGMVARRAGGLNGACEPRLGGRPALISAAPPPQRRGLGTGPEPPRAVTPGSPAPASSPPWGGSPGGSGMWLKARGRKASMGWSFVGRLWARSTPVLRVLGGFTPSKDPQRSDPLFLVASGRLCCVEAKQFQHLVTLCPLTRNQS